MRQALITSRYPAIDEGMFAAYEVLESMILEGWITAKYNKKRPVLSFSKDEPTDESAEPAAVM